jgi:hypothetical protein
MLIDNCVMNVLEVKDRTVTLEHRDRKIDVVLQESGDFDIFEADGRTFEYETDEEFAAVIYAAVRALPVYVFND